MKGDAIITSLLIHSRDPGGSCVKVGVQVAEGKNALSQASAEVLYEYLRPFAETVRDLPCARIVLHDGLPEELIARCHWLQFEQLPLDRDGEDAWRARYRLLRRLLSDRPEIERLFFVDCNDVGIFRDPFAWWDSLGVPQDWPVVGEEWTPFGDNKWFTDHYPIMPEKLRGWFEHRLADSLPLSAGLWGGRRDVVLQVVDSMLRNFDEFYDLFAQHPASWDMFAFNYALYAEIARFVAFKMDDFAPPHKNCGASIRGAQSPFVHHRPTVMSRIVKEDEAINARVMTRVPSTIAGKVGGLLGIPRCHEPGSPYSAIDRCGGLAELILDRMPEIGRVVETGRYWGVSTLLLATLRPGLSIISVDNFPHENGLARLAGVPNVELVTADAGEYLDSLPDGSVDAVYIDDDHSYAAVKQRASCAKRKVRRGGIVAGHDYGAEHVDVIRAVNEVFGRPPHYVYADSSWAYLL